MSCMIRPKSDLLKAATPTIAANDDDYLRQRLRAIPSHTHVARKKARRLSPRCRRADLFDNAKDATPQFEDVLSLASLLLLLFVVTLLGLAVSP